MKNLVYLDNSASSKRTESFISEYLRLQNLNKTRSSEEEKNLLKQLAIKLAQLLNVHHSTISFTPNSTWALNEIAYFLSSSQFPIYLSTSEHSSNHLIWLKLFNPNNIKWFDFLSLKDIQLPNKKSIFSFSSTTNLEGFQISISEINKKFSNTPHICIVDSSQTFQYEIPNLENSPISYLVFTAHKFFGPNGLGIIYDKDSRNLGLNEKNYHQKPDYSLDFDGIEAWINTIDEVTNLFQNNHVFSCLQILINHWKKNFPENSYLSWINKKTCCGIFLLQINHEYLSAHDYSTYLFSKGIVVRPGLSCSWLSSEKFDSTKLIRVSISFQNTISDLEKLFESIRTFSPETFFLDI